MNVCEIRDYFHQRRVALRSRNNFQQPHVTWRIKEMSAEPGLAEILRKSFCNLRDWQPAGIGGDDGSRLTELLELFKQRSLDLEVFNHYLDDPINLGYPSQIVLKIPRRDQRSKR